jgi:hypothetical protein
MCDVVHDLLVARRQLGDGVFCFPSHSRSGHLEHVSTAVKVLGQKIGFAFSMHDLRRTFITVAEAIDATVAQVKAKYEKEVATLQRQLAEARAELSKFQMLDAFATWERDKPTRLN